MFEIASIMEEISAYMTKTLLGLMIGTAFASIFALIVYRQESRERVEQSGFEPLGTNKVRGLS